MVSLVTLMLWVMVVLTAIPFLLWGIGVVILAPFIFLNWVYESIRGLFR